MSKEFIQHIAQTSALLATLASSKLPPIPETPPTQETALVQNYEEILQSYQHEQKTRLDGLIVLGAGKSHQTAKLRANTAADYFQTEQIPIIATGYKNEASEIAEELERRGVNQKVVLEPTSKNTYENFNYSKGLIHLLEIKRLGVVTTPSHMSRAIRYGRAAFNQFPKIDCKLYPVYSKIRTPTQILTEICFLAWEFKGIVKSLFE